ncbi:MAG: DUF6268 family outer membrane beta-barrel protein [Myxococcota bacterium]
MPALVTSTVTLVALMATSASPAAAQLPELARVSAQYVAPTDLDGTMADVQVTSYDVNLNVPIPLSESTFLIPGLAYHVDSVAFGGDTTGINTPRSFHAVGVPVLFVQLLPQDWALSIRLAPSFAGDFTSLDGRMFLFSAVALATHAFNERIVFGFGAVANYSFGSFLPLPALFVNWEPTDYFRVEGFLPAFVNATFHIGERVELGMRGEVQGNSYGIRDERIAGRWPCRAQGNDDPATVVDETESQESLCLDHIAYSVGSVGLTAAVRTFETLWLGLYAGHTVFRRYERMNRHADSLDGGQSLPRSWLLRAELSWRLPTP